LRFWIDSTDKSGGLYHQEILGQKELPQIPWSQVIGMRNRLIHAYFEVNLDIVWDVITDDLPLLIVELEKIIES
jgi:uncharacterized protein with HEPN domain